jgi:hypothetical protein
MLTPEENWRAESRTGSAATRSATRAKVIG